MPDWFKFTICAICDAGTDWVLFVPITIPIGAEELATECCDDCDWCWTTDVDDGTEAVIVAPCGRLVVANWTLFWEFYFWRIKGIKHSLVSKRVSVIWDFLLLLLHLLHLLCTLPTWVIVREGFAVVTLTPRTVFAVETVDAFTTSGCNVIAVMRPVPNTWPLGVGCCTWKIRVAGKLATVKFEPDTVVLVPGGNVVNTLDGSTGPRILIAKQAWTKPKFI